MEYRFEIGQKVKFYVKRFKKWYQGTILNVDDELTKDTGNTCYSIRTVDGYLWAVEGMLIRGI